MLVLQQSKVLIENTLLPHDALCARCVSARSEEATAAVWVLDHTSGACCYPKTWPAPTDTVDFKMRVRQPQSTMISCAKLAYAA